MKKLVKVAAACSVALTLFAANAVAKKADKGEATKKEKAAKPAKSKPVKKLKFDQTKYDAAYAAGDYATCAGMLLGKNDDKTLIKDMLDADMLMYLNADYQNAGKGFLETYSLMQQTSSKMNAGEVISAALVGEDKIQYAGAEYERYLDWAMRLSTALGNKQNDVARGIMSDYTSTFMAEIQALRAQNEEMAQKSEAALESDDFKKAAQFLENPKIDVAGKEVKIPAKINLGITEMLNEKPAKPTEADKYASSPFFSYLGVVAFAANDEFDHAEQFASDFKVAQAKDTLNIPSGKGRLEVVALAGTIGKREDAAKESTPTITFGGHSFQVYKKVAYPTFKKQSHEIESVSVTLKNEDTGDSAATRKLPVIEDFDEAVRKDVNQKARAAYSRSVFRNVVKNAAVIGTIFGAIEGAKKAEGNPVAVKVAAKAIEIAIDAAPKIVENEKADIRQGVYFPHTANAAGFSVEPGTYTVTIEYKNGKGEVVKTKTVENVAVSAGKVSVAFSSCEE